MIILRNSTINRNPMNRIKEIWNQIDSSPSTFEGISKVRFSQTSSCHLYLGKKTPENARLLAISVSIKNGRNVNHIKNLKGLRIERILDSQKEGNLLLNLVLLDDHFRDIFDVLINDIIINVIDLSVENEIVHAFSNRIGQWQTLFEKYKPEGLPEEYQRGLYGELYMLRRAITEGSDPFKLVRSWVGSSNAIQDFQFDNSAIEVKVSAGNNHQKVHINNERQLDETALENLFLFHISVDVRVKKGETLNDVVNEIRSLLMQDSSAYALFNHKLIEAGYFDMHKEIYSVHGYSIRDTNYYRVHARFPRLTESAIPEGVGDIKYTINISDCTEYSVSEPDVLKLIL